MEEKIAIHEMSISNLIYWLYAFSVFSSQV